MDKIKAIYATPALRTEEDAVRHLAIVVSHDETSYGGELRTDEEIRDDVRLLWDRLPN